MRVIVSNLLRTSLLLAASACGDDASSNGGDDDSGDGGDGPMGGPPSSKCDDRVTEASLCLGTASGRPGERIPIGMHILLPEGCPLTTQVRTTLVPAAPIGPFVEQRLDPPDSCWSLDNPGPGQFMYLSRSATSGCPRDLLAGLLVEIELVIGQDTAAGDYDIALTNSSLGDNVADQNGGCRGKGGIGGRVTVLP